MAESPALLVVEGLSKTYRGHSGPVHALRDVSFALEAGQSLAIVGESGSGKTTAAMCVAGLARPDAGRVLLAGQDFLAARGAAQRRMRRGFGVVLQNPLTSFDPRVGIGRSVVEPLEVHETTRTAAQLHRRAVDALERVGLAESHALRLPHELSGGQLQRAAIARALMLEPRLVILDEPTSALDVSIQAQVLNLLCDLRDERGLSYLFITHNLALVPLLASQVMVMNAGRVIERGAVRRVFDAPEHPYTAELLASVPDADAGIPPHTAVAPAASAPSPRQDTNRGPRP